MTLTRRDLWNGFAAQGLEPDVAFRQLGLKRPGPKRVATPRTHPTELQEQQAVCAWWKDYAPTQRIDYRLLYAVPNGSFLFGDEKRRAQQAQILKSSGMRPGAVDLVLDVARQGCHGLRIEMKSVVGHVETHQTEIHDLLAAQGYSVAVCHGASQGIAAIRKYVEGR